MANPYVTDPRAGPVPIISNSLGGVQGLTANAQFSLSLVPPTSTSLAFITGFDVFALGATAGSTKAVTLTGISMPGGGNGHNYYLSVPAGATSACTPFPLSVNFPFPIPASGPGVSITLTVPALGAGNTTTDGNIRGFFI